MIRFGFLCHNDFYILTKSRPWMFHLLCAGRPNNDKSWQTLLNMASGIVALESLLQLLPVVCFQSQDLFGILCFDVTLSMM